MKITVLFIKVEVALHKGVKTESTIVEEPMYKIYNRAMNSFSMSMKLNELHVCIEDKPQPICKNIRVEKIDSEIYKSFKITCIQKDISISQGINLALKSWLESQSDDISELEVRE